MKKTILLFTILSVLFISNTYSQKGSQEFKATDIYGEMHILTDYLNDGKYVFIDFFTLTCGTCQQKAPIVDSVYRYFGCNSNDIIFLGIECTSGGQTTNEQVYDFCQQFSLTFDAISGLSGGRGIADIYQISYTPYMLLISPDNEIVMDNFSFYHALELQDTLLEFGIVPNTCEGADFLRYELITEIDTIKGKLNNDDKTINIQVPFGTDLTNCGSLFVSETNSDVYIGYTEQISGENTNNFSQELIYSIFAENSNIENNWTIVVNEVSEIPNNENNIKIYPNPTSDFIFINNNNINNKIEIFDNKGNLVLSKKVIDNKLNINNLENGIYFIKIKREDNIFVEKLIIKK